MGKLAKAVLLLVVVGGVGSYVLIRQFAPGKTPAEKMENTKQELQNVKEMVQAALPKPAPASEGTGLAEILDGSPRNSDSAAPPLEVEGTVLASSPATEPARQPRAEPPKAGDSQAKPGAAAPAAPPAPAAAPARTHVVAEGETLSQIASKYFGKAGAWKRIAEANPGLDPDRLRVGASLVIPPETQVQAPASAERPGPAAAAREAAPRKYKIQSGDTLVAIARRELGDENRWKDIEKLNPDIDPDRLSVGQEIVLP